MLSHQPALARHLDSLVARHGEIEQELADGSAGFSTEQMKELSKLTPSAATL